MQLIGFSILPIRFAEFATHGYSARRLITIYSIILFSKNSICDLIVLGDLHSSGRMLVLSKSDLHLVEVLLGPHLCLQSLVVLTTK